MTALHDAALTMPTVVFTVLLGLVLLYWLTFLFGLLDLEIFDSLLDFLEGLFGGATEAAVEGVAEGLLEGATEGLADDNAGCFGLGGVPLAITGTFLTFFGWCFSLAGTWLAATVPLLAGGGLVLTLGIGAVALIASVGATGLAIRPFRKLFHIAPVTHRRDLVGRTCKVTTLEVDGTFGQAEVLDDEGVELLIQVRSLEPSPDLVRHARALIYEYDSAKEIFFIVPFDDALSPAGNPSSRQP